MKNKYYLKANLSSFCSQYSDVIVKSSSFLFANIPNTRGKCCMLAKYKTGLTAGVFDSLVTIDPCIYSV